MGMERVFLGGAPRAGRANEKTKAQDGKIKTTAMVKPKQNQKLKQKQKANDRADLISGDSATSSNERFPFRCGLAVAGQRPQVPAATAHLLPGTHQALPPKVPLFLTLIRVL